MSESFELLSPPPLPPFAMTRPHLEIYVRWMEEQRGYAPATPRGGSRSRGVLSFAVIDGYLYRSPAEYVRRPHVPGESQALGLDLIHVGALVAAARAASPDDAVLITMLGVRKPVEQDHLPIR